MLFGALEAGGTKMVLAIGDESGKISELLINSLNDNQGIMGCIELTYRALDRSIRC
jgi:hypothetical protein